MKVKSESEVAQWCSTLSDPMNCTLPGSSTHGIFQERVLEWDAIAFSGIDFGAPQKSQTRLSDFTFTVHFHALEKEMATHSSVLAWRIPESDTTGVT